MIPAPDSLLGNPGLLTYLTSAEEDWTICHPI